MDPMRSLFFTALIGVVGLTVSACSVTVTPGTDAPVIDSVSYPFSVDAFSDGSYDIPITVDFHDNSELVDTVHLEVSGVYSSFSGDFPISPAVSSGPVQVTVTLPAGTEDGTIQPFDFYLDLVSVSGLISANSASDTISLCPLSSPGC
jgi:hypothetical protein